MVPISQCPKLIKERNQKNKRRNFCKNNNYLPKRLLGLKKLSKTDPPNSLRPLLKANGSLTLTERIIKSFKLFKSSGANTTALHSLVEVVEETLKEKEALVSSFMDIEGAFDRVTYESMEAALKRFNVPTDAVK
ncbi:hypothetical protein J6590_072815 [Homalodisca vitripennis]|nr:hypothetical protein J6590_072815 [Homalodisca vitripennis]